MQYNLDLVLPWVSVADGIRIMLAGKAAAGTVVKYYYNANAWDISGGSLISKMNVLLAHSYCKYCKQICGFKGCDKHWCDSCDMYCPIYDSERLKRPFMCQKCSPCESCGMAAKTYRYITLHEYGITRIEMAMVVCDKCTQECPICESRDIRLCVTDFKCLVRCPRCIDSEFNMVVKNFTIE